MNKLAVIALGGNALLRGNEKGTISDQEKNAKESVEAIVKLVKNGYRIVITHGNGPQVGNVLMRNDAGEKMYDIAPMPMDICIADLQGGIGYILERTIRNIFNSKNVRKDVVTILSMVEVSPKDPAFSCPSKRIGKIYTEQESVLLNKNKGWSFKSSPKLAGGYRRVVPSPKPLNIINYKTIKKLVDKNNIVITLGGGGIPVYYEDKTLQTIEAVVDKDVASSLLASQLHAHELYILTDVPFIYTDFGKTTQKELRVLDLNDARTYLEKGAFGEGSMEPKIKACLSFLENGGQKCVITEASKLGNGSYGTTILKHYN